MEEERIIRAWRDPDYRASLTAAERAELPDHPAAPIEPANDDLALADADDTIRQQPDPTRHQDRLSKRALRPPRRRPGRGRRPTSTQQGPADPTAAVALAQHAAAAGPPRGPVAPPGPPTAQPDAPLGEPRPLDEAATPPAAAAWSLALTLAERARLPMGRARRRRRGDPRDAAARRHLERWRALAPFADPERWQRRLAADGLDEQALLALLAETPEDLARRCAPGLGRDWLRELTAAFERPAGPPAMAATAMPGAAADQIPDAALAFLDLLDPLLRARRANLEQRLAPPAAAAPGLLPSAEETAALLLPHLGHRLAGLLARTLVLELHVAGRLGLLTGATPAARFQRFRERLRQPPVALDLLRRYPVLARLAVERTAQAVSASAELIERLAADRREIRAAFSPDPDRLVEVAPGAGDPHRGGRTVTLLRFASGLRLVYKPKSVAVEATFQDLLRWLEQRGLEPPLRTLRVVARGRRPTAGAPGGAEAYGWVEHVAHEPCRTAAAVDRFYERLGALLAVLYALGASDMHAGNLIAAGEHPILVDLETLFHPSLDDLVLAAAPDPPPAATAGGAASPPRWRSVLGVGLLPERLWPGAGHPGVDLSGIGGGPAQTSPRPALQLLDAGTDRMRFTRGRIALPPAANRPALAGADVHPEEHADAVAAGFVRAYRLLLAVREDLLVADGPLDAFAGTEVRVVLRGTGSYRRLRTEGLHPDVLGDALRRDELFDRLWGGTSAQPRLAPLLAAERLDLEQGDIPIFTTRPDTRDLWTSRGQRLPDFLPASGLERVRQSIARLHPTDLAIQQWQLRAALATLDRPREDQSKPSSRR